MEVSKSLFEIGLNVMHSVNICDNTFQLISGTLANQHRFGPISGQK